MANNTENPVVILNCFWRQNACGKQQSCLGSATQPLASASFQSTSQQAPPSNPITQARVALTANIIQAYEARAGAIAPVLVTALVNPG
jgi:hypothetical protein